MPDLPSFEISATRQPREIMLNTNGMVSAGVVIDGDLAIDGDNTPNDEIRAGFFLGQITATKKFVPVKRTTIRAGGGATGLTHGVVDAASFREGDTITIGADTGLTIASVTYSTNDIVLTGSITSVDAEDVEAENGSQTALGILLDSIKLRDARNENDADKGARSLVAGVVKASQLLGDTTAIRADTNAELKGIIFSDDQGLDA